MAPLDRSNVDTDQIIPKQFLKAVVRSGLGTGLFYDWRSQPDKDFVLDQPRSRALRSWSRANFGSGSSREHAVWALADFGFRAVIAPSFADIFRNNCFKNGFLPIALEPQQVEAIFQALKQHEGYTPADRPVRADRGRRIRVGREVRDRSVPEKSLLEGLDEIALTLLHEDEMQAFESEPSAAVSDTLSRAWVQIALSL